MESKMLDHVQASVAEMLTKIKGTQNDTAARTALIRESLLEITEKFTTEQYNFNFAMDIFVEKAHENLSEYLEQILDEANSEDNSDLRAIGFAALYALSLIYKKEGNIDKLCGLLDEKYKRYREFPLYFEVHSRYYKRVKNFTEALQYDKRAINILRSRQITNLALCISYASTVCNMLSNDNPSLSEGDIKLAKKYINDAIKFNPDYPKYYFLKAKLVFLSVANSPCTLSALESAGSKARKLIEQAELTLYNIYRDTNVFVKEELQNYNSFRAVINEKLLQKKYPRFPQSDIALSNLKKKILVAKSQDVCVSTSILPPLPELRSGDKYFFICYSSRDFQSVYCDLIELYKRKIPFKYDEKLTQGLDWQQQIAEAINDVHCAGVVFYLSKHIFSTNSVFEEIKLTSSAKKPYFCINLEGNKVPSQILCELIVERHQANPDHYAIPGEHMSLFLNYFSDSQVFTQKMKENGKDGSAHFDAFSDAITRKFPEILIGD